MEPILLVIGTMAAVVALPLTWLIAKRQGAFERSQLRINLHGIPADRKKPPELVVAGPHSKYDILTPILISLSNTGSATASDIEVSIESSSSTVVNHPNFFISPIVTSSTETAEGDTVYLGGGIFRRIFRITNLHPGKTVQLNNAGLPRNVLNAKRSLENCILTVKIFAKGEAPRSFRFGIWHLDTSEDTFEAALRKLAQTTRREFELKSRLRRFITRLLHRKHQRSMKLIEITGIRPARADGIKDSFVTVDTVQISSGVRLATGWLFVGPFGFL